MRAFRILSYTLVCALLIAGLGLLIVLTLDLNDYRANIQEIVERQTGRTLTIAGRIDLELGRQSTLTVNDVTFGNPDWATDPYMAHIGHGKVVIDLVSLWSGPVSIELAELERAALNLELLENGNNNWTFAADSSPSKAADTVGSSSFLSLLLKQAYGNDFRLTIRAPVFVEPFDLHVIGLTQSLRDDGLFDARLNGTLNERKINISGEYGSLNSLLTGKDLQLDIGGQFDTLTVALTALVDDLSGPRRPQVNLKLQAPEIDDVTGMLGLRELGDGQLNIALSLLPGAQTEGDDDLQLVVSGIIGQNQVDARGTLSDLSDFERIELQVKASGPDLKRMGQTFGQNTFPPGPFNVSGSISRDGSRLAFNKVSLDIGEARLQLDGELPKFPDISGATLVLGLNGEDIGNFTRLFGLAGKARGPFSVNGQLQIDAQGLEKVTLAVDTQMLKLNLDGKLKPDTGINGATARVSGRSDELSTLADLFELPLATSEALIFSGDIKIVDETVVLPEPLMVTLGDIQLKTTGTIGFDPLGDQTRISYAVNGPDLKKALQVFAVDAGLPALAFEASGDLTASTEGIRLIDAKARIGEYDLNVDGLISLRTGMDGTRLTIAAQGPELKTLYPGPAPEWLPDSQFTVKGTFGLSATEVELDAVNFTLGDVQGDVTAAVGLPLEKLNISYVTNVSGDNLRTLLPKAGAFQPAELPFQLSSSGRLDDLQLRIEKTTFEVGTARATASGVFDLPPDLSKTNLNIAVSVEDLSALGILNEKALPERELRLNATFAGSPDSFSIQSLTVKSNGSDLTGSILVDLQNEIPDLRVDLKSNLLVLPGLSAFEDSTDEQAKAKANATETVKVAKKDERFIPDLKLPVEQLQRVNAVVDFDVKDFQQFPWRIKDLALDVQLQDGRLEVERVSGQTKFGSIAAELLIEPTESATKVFAGFRGQNMLIGGSLDKTLEEIENTSKFQVDISIDSSGDGLRELAANLNGGIKISADSGRAENTALRFIYGNFLEEIYTAINPFAKTDNYTVVSCIMLVAIINDGLVEATPGIAIQTDKMNILSAGTVNLRNEKLDINFKTAPRSKVSISAGEFINPYLKVSGTLANPRLVLDPTGTIVTGGAAFATAGLSLVAKALWDRVFASSDPCGQVVIQAEKNLKNKDSSGFRKLFNR